MAIVAVTGWALSGLGANVLYLTWRVTRLRPQLISPLRRGDEPMVCVQVPIYNECYVAERVLDAVCELDWPSERLEVQILDDSDDDTVSIVARRAAHWRRRGIDVVHLRRNSRPGFKSGALAHGMTLTDSPFMAIFDADFIPPRDFLRRSLGAFDDPAVRFAQAPSGHPSQRYPSITRPQTLSLHFPF